MISIFPHDCYWSIESLPVHLPIREGMYVTRFLDKVDIFKMLELQDTIAQNLPRPEIFRLDPPEYVLGHFDGDHNVIGVFAAEKLVAYHVISFPGLHQDNFGRDIHLTAKQLRKVAHFETTAVHPEHRSQKLAKKMAELHIHILDYSGYDHVLCTVSPINFMSLNNVFRQGFLIKGLKEKYYGMRYIMYKNLKSSKIRKPNHILWLNHNELAQQQTLLTQGYYGFAVQNAEVGLKIAYGCDRLNHKR